MGESCITEGALSQETFDKIEDFLQVWPDAEFGPGHIALSDCNLTDIDIQHCLSGETWGWMSEGHAIDELAATRKFLEGLLAIPENIR